MDKGAGPKRARYNSGVIDANSLIAGTSCDELREIYVIFITENDVLGGNQPLYHIERTIKETGKLFEDGAHIIYVNGEYRDESPVGLLMHDFSCANPADMHYKILADKTRYFKEDEKGVSAMRNIMEELRNDARIEEKREIAQKLILEGSVSFETIARCVGLSIEEIEQVAEESKVLV